MSYKYQKTKKKWLKAYDIPIIMHMKFYIYGSQRYSIFISMNIDNCIFLKMAGKIYVFIIQERIVPANMR